MHSMTSRRQERQERQGPQDDITKVKTLQDATLKASRLYGMMRDFIHPSKINYRKIHSKWRNVKKQVQVGGVDKIITVSPKAETGAEPVVDKDCVELPPKMSLHVTTHPDDPKKFIVTKKDGDPLINGSLTTFAEGLMGHLDKIKSGIEIDTGDADILALIAHDLIGIILDVLDEDEDEDDEDDTEDKRRLAAALDRESRNAAAAAIIIALIGLIKNKGDAGDEVIESVDNKDATIRRLEDEIERLRNVIGTGFRILIALSDDNQDLRDQVGHLQQDIQDRNAVIQRLIDTLRRLRDLNAVTAQEVARLQRDNQILHDAIQAAHNSIRELGNRLTASGDANDDLRRALRELGGQLDTSKQQNAALQDQLQGMNQALQAQRAANSDLEDTNAGNVARIDALTREVARLVGLGQGHKVELDAAQAALDAARAELGDLQLADQRKNVQLDQHERENNERVQQLERDLARLRDATGDHGAEIANKERELQAAQLDHQNKLLAAHDEARRLREADQERIRQLEEENTITADKLARATSHFDNLQSVLRSLRQDDEARLRVRAQLDEERLKSENLERQLSQHAAELDELRQRQQATDLASADALRITLDALKQQLAGKLEQVKNKIQNLPQQQQRQQQQLQEKADEIDRLIRDMQNATLSNDLDAQITRLKDEVDQAIQQARQAEEVAQRAAQREQEDRARQEAEQARATEYLIRERLTTRFREMPGSEVSKQPIRDRIDVASTLQDECDITKDMLKVELDIERVKITALNDADMCKDRYIAKVGEINASIESIVCSVDGIERGYSNIKTNIKELREAQGDKLRTFVVMRGGGDANAEGITLNAHANTVEWTPLPGSSATTVRFSGVFQVPQVAPEIPNEDKYMRVKELLDKIPVDQATVVIFGYGYSGSGKTYTLLGKRIEDTLKSLALADKQKLKSIETTLQAKMRSVKTAPDHGRYETAITDLKEFLKENRYDSSQVDHAEDVEGIAHIAIRNYIRAYNEVILEEVFEMYDDSYYFTFNRGDGVGKYRPELPIFGYDINGEMRRWPTLQGLKLNYNIDVNKFNDVIRKVEQTRRTHKHIKPTPNNPESSRGHLFIKLKITHRNGTNGRLIICDMGGRENPKYIWDTGQYCPSKKEDLPPIPISRANPDVAYTDDGIEVECTAKDRLSFSKAFSKGFDAGRGGINLETALQEKGTSGNPKILQTLKQGFYINDSINELLHVFGYKGIDKPSNWTDIDPVRKQATGKWTYTPEVRAISVSEHIRMKLIFDKFKEESDCKITFCTFACIRPESTFNDDNVNTLNFARDVNSCSDSAGGGGAAIGGGAKTRRNRSQGKIRTQRRRRRIVKSKSHPVTVTTQRRNLHDKKGHRTRKMT